MADMYAVPGETLTEIANAIRRKTGSDEFMTVSSMAASIERMQSVVVNIATNINTVDYVVNTYIEENNGNESLYLGWNSTGFIPIPDGSNAVFISGVENKYRGFYDLDKKHIEPFYKNFEKLPNGAKFIRLSCSGSSFNYKVFPLFID